MDSATKFPIRRKHFTCKPTFKGILSKLVQNRKLNYVHARKSLPVVPPKEHVLAVGKVNLCTKFDKNRTRNGSAIVDTSLKVSETGSKWTRMRVYYFRCYWPSNLVFVARCVTYIRNLRKIGQKLWTLSWTIGISDRRMDTHTDRQTDGHTYTQVISYTHCMSNALHCIGQTTTLASIVSIRWFIHTITELYYTDKLLDSGSDVNS